VKNHGGLKLPGRMREAAGQTIGMRNLRIRRCPPRLVSIEAPRSKAARSFPCKELFSIIVRSLIPPRREIRSPYIFDQVCCFRMGLRRIERRKKKAPGSEMERGRLSHWRALLFRFSRLGTRDTNEGSAFPRSYCVRPVWPDNSRPGRLHEG